MMREWVVFKAYAKLARIMLLVAIGIPENKLTLSVTPEEADVLLELATECGWRALIVGLIGERNAA